MFFLLPDEINGVIGLIRNLNASSLTDLIASMRKVNKNGNVNGVNVRIPKFELDSQFNLNQVLNSLGKISFNDAYENQKLIFFFSTGIRSLFNGNECDLSNMITTNLNLKDKLTQLNQGLKQNNQLNNQLNTIINPVNPISNSMFNDQQYQTHVNEFSHKSILQVDEEGSLGASASATIVERVGLDGVYFEADHPFIYFLTDKQSGLILFSGIFANQK